MKQTIGRTVMCVVLATIALIMVMMMIITTTRVYPSHTLAAPALLATQKSGTIAISETWVISGSPYLLTDNVVVPTGAVLTIEPGVEIRGKSGKELLVHGMVSALGTETTPITFTSEANNEPETWHGVVFDGGAGHLRHVVVRYGGQTNSIGIHSNISIRNVTDGTVRIEQSIIQDGHSRARTIGQTDPVDYGLYIENSTVVVSNTAIYRNGNLHKGNPTADYAVYVKGDSSRTTFVNNTLTENQCNRVRYEQIHFGDAPDVVFAPQAIMEGYEFDTAIVVPKDKRLVVEPGVMMMQRSFIEVQGSISAVGSATQPITFTSATNTGSGQWGGLYFNGSAGQGSGTLNRVVVRYGGTGNGSDAPYSNITALNVQYGMVRILNSTIEQEHKPSGLIRTPDYGIYVGNSNLSIANSTIHNNGNNQMFDQAMRVEGNSQVVVRCSTVSDNQEGISVQDGNVAIQYVTLKKNIGTALSIAGGSVPLVASNFENNGRGLNYSNTGTFTAVEQWWGSATGPIFETDSTVNPGGTGDRIGGAVNFMPFLTEPVTECPVPTIYLPIILQ